MNPKDEFDTDEPYYPGPETVDPAPMLGQVGEGRTLESGEIIARELRELIYGARSRKERQPSADPEMPIPAPGGRNRG